MWTLQIQLKYWYEINMFIHVLSLMWGLRFVFSQVLTGFLDGSIVPSSQKIPEGRSVFGGPKILRPKMTIFCTNVAWAINGVVYQICWPWFAPKIHSSNPHVPFEKHRHEVGIEDRPR